MTQDSVSAHRARQEYAIVTSHDFCLVYGAGNGLRAVEERGVCDDQGTILQRLNRAVRKGKDCSKEGQKTSNTCLLGIKANILEPKDTVLCDFEVSHHLSHVVMIPVSTIPSHLMPITRCPTKEASVSP